MSSRKLITLTAVAAVVLVAPAVAQADYQHVVEPGESLSSIAAADGLSVGALAAANGLSPDAGLVAGETVAIPPQGDLDTADAASSAVAPTSPTSFAAAANGGYEVVPGDTLSGIAARDGVSLGTLAAYNGIDPAGVLVAGTVLRLPAAGSDATAADATAATTGSDTGPATGPGNQQLATAPSTGPYPTHEYVSGSQVGSEASAGGVDPALAEAVGWQESGYSNDLVSGTGAVGVMQIEPATWSWINAELTPGAPLDPASALANVRGGVMLLHHLVAETGSDSMAAAAYYQGLASIREHGLYPSTQQYVADVMALKARFGG